MKRHSENNAGMALVFVVLATVAILGLMVVVMTDVLNSTKSTNEAYNQVLLEEATQAGVELGIQALWTDYLEENSYSEGTWADYRSYLDDSLEIPINEDLNFNGVQDIGEAGNGLDGFQELPPESYPHGFSLLDDPFELRDPNDDRLLATVDSVNIARYDTVGQSRLTVRATASAEGRSLTAVQYLKIGGDETTHGQFAILANNVNCILCHAEIRGVDMANNTDPGQYGTFDRVKIASFESLLVRQSSEVDSQVAGTVYTRGRVYKPSGSEYSAEALEGTYLDTYQFDEYGKVEQDGSGNTTQIDLVDAELDENGELLPLANLYMEYPEDLAAQTDGSLPASFPAPFPDDDYDRIVGDDEFQVVIDANDGSLSGGIIHGIPTGETYDDDGLPTSSNDASTTLSLDGSYDGSVFLVGTEEDPIMLNESITINGDLVISGPVQGVGKLLVRGNTYIAGDVTYMDAEGQFGVDSNGDENTLAIITGGSIMMGDYLTIRGVNHSDHNDQKYPKWSKYSINVREENKSNTYNGEFIEYGYFDQWSTDPGEEVEGKPGQQFSFTQSELMLFNNMELEKAIEDETYVPRFYGLRESQPNNIYIYDDDDEHSVRYSEDGVKLLGDYLIEEEQTEILNRAVYHYSNPTGNWLSEDQLREIWHDDEMTRPSEGRSFNFDGLLYSNNAIFTIVRSNKRHKSNTFGNMRIRGGVIASDLGMFIPGNNGDGGLTLEYDERIERFLELVDTELAVFQRSGFYYERPDAEV